MTRSPTPDPGHEDSGPWPGTPFHHLAGDEPSLLRDFVAMAVCMLGAAAVTQIPRYDILSVHWTSHDGVPALPLLGAATPVVSWYAETALALPLLLAVVLVISRRRLSTIVSVTGRVRWAWLGTCTLTACGALAVAGAGAWLLHPAGAGVTVETTPTTGTYLLTVVLIVLAGVYAVTLELLFRGWFLQALGSDLPAWVVILLQAAVFAAGYAPGLTGWGYADLALSAVVAGWLAVHTGGIEAAVALPIVWNGGVAAIAFLTTGDADPTRGMIASSWQTLVVHLSVVIAYAAVTRFLASYRSVTVGVPPDTCHGRIDQEPAPP